MKREHQSWLFIYLTYRPPGAFLTSIRNQMMSIRVGDMGMGGICDITNRNLNRDLDLTKADTHTHTGTCCARPLHHTHAFLTSSVTTPPHS
jgi:hypothetical protein